MKRAIATAPGEDTLHVDLTPREVEARAAEEAAEAERRRLTDYIGLRKREYPSIEEQVEALLKHFQGKQGLRPELQTVIEQWEAVRAKYPKPEDVE